MRSVSMRHSFALRPAGGRPGVRHLARSVPAETEAQLKRALERQLRRSLERRNGKDEHTASMDEDDAVVADTIEARRAEAQAWIAAWRGDELGEEPLAADVVASSPAAPAPDAPAPAQPAAKAPAAAPAAAKQGSKFAPARSFDDGSVLFESAALQATSFEELLK